MLKINAIWQDLGVGTVIRRRKPNTMEASCYVEVLDWRPVEILNTG